ncbi:MAG: 30S ribosomal protein S20 [Cardiobacteriaceae bacterium]|nr:30S ribosomal protein S20 [Cardiobacteriaceae bacterium]
MANTAQAKKRVRQAEKARARNASQRSAMRTAVKKVLKAVEAKDQATAEKNYRYATCLLDRAARKGLVHKNKAARLKSRINAKIRAIAA